MEIKSNLDVPQWYVIHTKPQQETRATSNLTSWGVETFYPRIKRPLDADRLGVRRFIVQPLFPGYIFARFVGNDMLHKLCFTRGVHSVLSFGGVPAAIHNEIVAELQSRVDEKDGLINICVPSNVRQLTPGDRVAIKRGPMKDLVGVFEKNLKDRERIAILLTAVKYQTRVIVAPDLIRKVS